MLLLVTGLLGGCKEGTSLPSSKPPKAVRDREQYPVRIHSFWVEETSVTVVFDGEKTLLIDCSHHRDADLITSYLRAQGAARIDVAVLASVPEKDPYPGFAVGEMWAVGGGKNGIKPVSADTGFLVGEASLRFVASPDSNFSAVLYYLNTPFSIPLTVTEKSAEPRASAAVMVQNPSPDGRQTELSFVPLKEMM